MFYNKEDWLYEYWTFASQYRSSNLEQIQPLHEFNKQMEFVLINKDEVEHQKREIECFEKFHIKLAGLLLYKERYSLLKKVLSFTQSTPFLYPLVPSSFSYICEVFIKINTSKFGNPFPYINQYFLGEKGLDRGKVTQVWMNKYLSLLLFRLNSYEVKLMPNWLEPWKHPQLPHKLKDLYNWQERMEQLSYFIKQWGEEINESILKEMGFTQEKQKPLEELESFIRIIKENISVKKKNVVLDKKDEFYETTKSMVSDALEVLSKFENSKKPNKDKSISYLLNGWVKRPFPNEAFSTDVTISHSGAGYIVAQQTVYNLYRDFCQNFFIVKKRMYIIFSEDLFKALDRMIEGKFKKYVVITFDIYLDNYLNGRNKINGFEKSDNKTDESIVEKYLYKKELEIISFPKTGNTLVGQTLAIIEKNDLPFIESIKPKKEIKKIFFSKDENKLDKEKGIYASLIKLSDETDIQTELLEKSEYKNLIDLEAYCLASVFCQKSISWKKDTNITMLRLFYPHIDSGTCTDIKDLPHLN